MTESTTGCPFHAGQPRPGLEARPPRIAALPLDKRGYPVPWFVEWINGEPEFRATSSEKIVTAIRQKLCWVCGEALGVHLAFVLGPMCGISRTAPEPPSHLECARWSARNCPFLNQTMMRRREDDLVNEASLQENTAGIAITRQPGVVLVWSTRSYRPFRDGTKGGLLIEVGEPERLEWYANGRQATRAEVAESVRTGLPRLQALVQSEEDEAELVRRIGWLILRYPAEVQPQ